MVDSNIRHLVATSADSPAAKYCPCTKALTMANAFVWCGSLPGTRVTEHEPSRVARKCLVISGSLSDADGTYEQGTWLRFPDGSRHQPYSDARLHALRQNRAPAGIRIKRAAPGRYVLRALR